MNVFDLRLIQAFFLTLFSFMLVACAGSSGSSGSDNLTVTISINSTGEGGDSISSALLLSDTDVGGTPSNTTGIILIHGRGGNPDSAVVRQLRNDLYGRG